MCDSDEVMATDPADVDGPAGRASAVTEVVSAPAGLPASETRIGEWRLLRRLPTTSHVRERYEASRDTDEREAIVTLYALGSEPDPDVYEILRTLDRDHVPEVLETGHYGDRAYEVTEDLRGGTFADLGLVADDVATLSRILEEVGGALGAFAECGLSHRDMRPGASMVRRSEEHTYELPSLMSKSYTVRFWN